MFGEKQGQQVGSGSVAVQAGGNVNIGLSVSEVRELVQLFMHQNFPTLREEAKAAAEEHAKVFLGKLEAEIVKSAQTIDPSRFQDPDVQAAMNDAVMASARRGDAANPDVLCALISERISARPQAFKDMVLSEAVQVVPKLTSAQIAMLLLVHALRSVAINNAPGLSVLEVLAKDLAPLVIEAENLSPAQIGHVQYTGACQFVGMFTTNAYSSQMLNFKHLGYEEGDTEKFKTDLKLHAPTYVGLIEQHDRNRFGSVSLTSVGQAIALARLSKILPGLDYSIWLS